MIHLGKTVVVVAVELRSASAVAGCQKKVAAGKWLAAAVHWSVSDCQIHFEFEAGR